MSDRARTLRQDIERAAEDIPRRSCGAEPGRKCETKKGKTLRKLHGRRLTDAVVKHLS